VPKGSHCPVVGVLETQAALVRAALVGLLAPGQEVERSLRAPGVFFRWLVAQPKGSFLKVVGAAGVELRMALYLLPFPASA
jgi:hypothetical protein